ncbi:MAG: hypothetical protein JW734_05860 [Candidatus Omnitrophica bacterium]|nr:hypothetical protein [Candidatus Omnitrophota bacterium]
MNVRRKKGGKHIFNSAWFKVIKTCLGCKEAPLGIRALLFFVLIILFIVPIASLKVRNDELKKNIKKIKTVQSKKNDKAVDFEYEYGLLRKKFVHDAQLLTPFIDKSRQMYPDLNTEEALSKILEDIERIHEFTISNTFRSLDEELRIQVIKDFSFLKQKHVLENNDLEIYVWTQSDSVERTEVKNELIQFIEEAGLKAFDGGEGIISYLSPPSVSIECNPEAYRVARDLWRILNSSFIVEGIISIREKSEIPKHRFKILLIGSPHFRSDGLIEF